MRLRDVFAHAIARRVAYVVVALVLAWVGVGKAHAGSGNHSTKQLAYEHCMAYLATVNYNYGERCFDRTDVSPAAYAAQYASTNGTTWNHLSWFTYTAVCPNGQVWDEPTKKCSEPPTCDDAPPTITFPGNQGAIMCQMTDLAPGVSMGCEFLAGMHPDGSGYVAWNPIGSCSPESHTCPSGYARDLELNICLPIAECPNNGPKDPASGECIPPGDCPAGQHKDSTGFCKPDPQNCPAGQIKAPDGTCIKDPTKCPTGTASGDDGSCKPDGDGDGNPDGENDDGTFSGGENCNAPPMCVGDNIQCGMARIQWRIDCNTRKTATISGGDCSTMPVCVGEGCDERLHKIQIMEWRTACAVEKMAKNQAIGGSTTGDANGNGQPDWTENPGDGTGQDLGPEGSSEGAISEGEEIGADGLDMAGLGWGSSCPAPPSLSVFGQALSLGGDGVLCDWLTLSGQFVLIMAALLSLRILAGGGSV